jgi:CelD/BcsL family acetyltransferase involved in cellulose biosynthesis
LHGTIDSLFRVEWRPLAALAPIAEQWRALAAEALEPNVFYEPAFAFAAAPVFGADVGAVLVWSRCVSPKLVGFFPGRIERSRWGLPLPVLVGWTHAYAPLGTPLVDREAAAAVIPAWLDHIATDPQLPKLVLLPYLAEGPVAQAIATTVAHRAGRSAAFARHQRALLSPGEERADYLGRSMARKKRKELRRQKRRLMEDGLVVRTGTDEPHDIDGSLADFFTLEAAGWKGRAGTAARDDARVRDFLKNAVRALAREGKVRIDRLLVDADPIAVMVTLRSGAGVWGWKIAYDEKFSRASPGVQLLLDVTQALLDDRSIARADSCATADHPMIDHIWRERLTLSDQLVSLGAGPAFVCACSLEASRRALVAAAKAVRGLVRR